MPDQSIDIHETAQARESLLHVLNHQMEDLMLRDRHPDLDCTRAGSGLGVAKDLRRFEAGDRFRMYERPVKLDRMPIRVIYVEVEMVSLVGLDDFASRSSIAFRTESLHGPRNLLPGQEQIKIGKIPFDRFRVDILR